MQTLKELGIPRNFEQLLPELKQKTLQWEAVCYSDTETNTSAKISSYHNLDRKNRGTFVLIPGLGSNSEIDPIGKVLSYWGITHKYNIITIDTFLGNFQPCPPEEEIQKRTFPEFIAILTQSVDFIEPYIINNYSCIVGHCASANGIMTVFNNRVKHHTPINYNSTMLFAPLPIMKANYYELLGKHFATNSFQDNLLTPQAKLKNDHFRYIAKMRTFEDQLAQDSLNFDFKTMASWGINTVLVSGGKDKTVPAQTVYDNWQKLQQINHTDKIKYVCFPNLKHSFNGMHTSTMPAIELIKTQRQIRTKQ